MNNLWMATALFAALSIAACGSSDDDSGNTAFGPQNDAPGSSCTTNVAGCDSGNFSCDEADFCYVSEEDCAQSGECGVVTTAPLGDPGTTFQPGVPTGSANSCTTNIDGCEASAFSCPAALNCYATSAACAQSAECPL